MKTSSIQRKTSSEGISALIQHEGIVPAPYYDSVGVLTYGVGHTSAAGSPDPADMPKGMPDDLDDALYDVFEVFSKDLANYEAAVDKAITVPVTQYEFDAAVSFHYNTGAISRATWVKTLNGGDKDLAAQQIMNWSSPEEIIPRRKAEQQLFITGEYPTEDTIVWGVNSNNKLTWQVVELLSPEECLGYMDLPDYTPLESEEDSSSDIEESEEIGSNSLLNDLTEMFPSEESSDNEPEMFPSEEVSLPEGYLSANFKASEFACKCCGKIPAEGIDEKLVGMLQQVRDHFGSPVVINSGYRCKEHNAAIGGEVKSQHLLGKAADIAVKSVKPNKVYAFLNNVNPRGGLGRYTTFTHIDTRNGRARW